MNLLRMRQTQAASVESVHSFKWKLSFTCNTIYDSSIYSWLFKHKICRKIILEKMMQIFRRRGAPDLSIRGSISKNFFQSPNIESHF